MRVLLVAYDNDSYIHWFPHGLAYIAAVLLREGYEVEVYHQDLHHYPDEHLTEHLDGNAYDFIGIGVIGGYYQYRKLLRISDAINKSKQRPYYFIGGHGPSPEPDYFLRKTRADAVVLGEGEVTVVELLEAVGSHRPLQGIKGIAYRDGGKTIVNERRPLITDVDSVPLPAYDLFPIEYYRLFRRPHCSNRDLLMPVISGRGCTFKCNFCYRMDPGHRPRSNEAIIDEIKFLRRRYGVNWISFSDELLMTSEKRTVGFCEDLLKADLGISWDCCGRLNYARPDILNLMRKAGCRFIDYGIEAYDDQILRNMNKSLTTQQIRSGIEATIAAGVSPGFNMIFGNIGENRDSLEKAVGFLLEYDDGSQLRTIRPVTPYPGSPLYYHAIEKGLLKDVADFYENKHLNSDLVAVNFTDMSDEEFHRALMDANTRLLKNYYGKKLESMIEQTKNLYLNRDASFRGYRQS